MGYILLEKKHGFIKELRIFLKENRYHLCKQYRMKAEITLLSIVFLKGVFRTEAIDFYYRSS